MSGNINSKTTKSMNGIISLNAEDIKVNTLDANNINVENLEIENSLLVNTTTITPNELEQLDGINTNETIQTQIDNINTEITDNLVNIDGTQTITGDKTFTGTTTLTGQTNISGSTTLSGTTDITGTTNLSTTNLTGTTTLTGNLNVDNQFTEPVQNPVIVSPEMLSVLYGINTDRPLQEVLNESGVSNVVYQTGNPQTISSKKTFTEPINVPSIETADNTGSITGYKINDTTILYNTLTGSYNENVSVISGIDTNSVLSSVDTNTFQITLSTIDTATTPLYTYAGYIFDSSTIILYDTTGLVQYQGIRFNSYYDFIDVISGYSVNFLQNLSALTPNRTQYQGFILNSNTFITPNVLSIGSFLEGNGITNPCRIFQVATNSYTIQSPNTITPQILKTSSDGFSVNNKFYYIGTSFAVNNDFINNTTVIAGNQVSLKTNDNFTYTLVNNDDTPYTTKSGIYIFNTLYVLDNTDITFESGVYDSSNDLFGFTDTIVNPNQIPMVKTDMVNQTPSLTINSYVNSDNKLVVGVDDSATEDKFFLYNQNFRQIGTRYLPFQMNILGGDLTPTQPQVYQGYKFDYNTLVIKTLSGNNPFLFELPQGQHYGSQANTTETGNTRYFDNVLHNPYQSPSITLNAVIIDVGFLNRKTLLLGNSNPSYNIGNFFTTDTYSPVSFATEILQTSSSDGNRFFSNAYTLNGLDDNVIPMTANTIVKGMIINQTYYFTTGSNINLNDILQMPSGGPRTGAFVSTKNTNYNVLAITLQNLTQNLPNEADTNPTYSNISYSASATKFGVLYVYISTVYATPVAGDFMIFDEFTLSVVSYVIDGSNYKINTGYISPTGFSRTGNNLNYYRQISFDTYRFFRPQTSKIHLVEDLNRFAFSLDFYDGVSYDFFNKSTNDFYEGSAYEENVNYDFEIFTNQSYTINTTRTNDFPSSNVDDVFVCETATQTLTNKTIGDDLIVNGGATISQNADINGLEVGEMDYSDWKGLKRPELNGSYAYSLMTSNTGRTIVNSASGQELQLRINNTNKVTVRETEVYFPNRIKSPQQPMWYFTSTAGGNQNYGPGSRIGSKDYTGGQPSYRHFNDRYAWNASNNDFNFNNGAFYATSGSGIYMLNLYIFCNNATAFSGRISLQTNTGRYQGGQYNMDVNRNTSGENCALLSWTIYMNANQYAYFYTHSSVLTCYVAGGHTGLRVIKLM